MLFYDIKEFKKKLKTDKLLTIEFARISRDDGFKNTESLENQASMLTRTIENNSEDLQSIKKYAQVVSGMKELEERGAAVDETLQLISNGGAHLLLIKEYSRFTRNPSLSSQLLDYCDLHYNRFRLFSLIDGMYSPDQRGIWEMKVAFYSNEVRTTIKRMKLGKIEKAEKGYFMGSHAPLGYTLHKKVLTKKYPECDIILDMHTRYYNGDFPNRKQLKDYLTARYPMHKWSNRKIAEMLTNPTYKGYNRWGYRKFYKTKFLEYNDDYVLQKSDYIDAIVPEDMFDYNSEKAQREISSRSKYKDAETYLFSGLLKCYCGATIYGYDGRYYICNRRKSAHDGTECNKKIDTIPELDKKILDFIKENYNNLGKADLNNITLNEDNQISKLESDIAATKERNKVLLESLQLKAITIQEFADEKRKNDTTITLLEDELKQKRAKKDKNDLLLTEKEIIQAVLSTTDKNKLRALLLAYIKEIKFINDFDMIIMTYF